jgi:hypothetical protein
VTEIPCHTDRNRPVRALARISGWSRHIPAPGSLPVPYPRSPEPAHPGHPGGPGDYRGQLPPGSRGVTVHDLDHPLPHTIARCPSCREVPGLPARHAGRPGGVFPAAARRGWLPSRNMRKSPSRDLPRESAGRSGGELGWAAAPGNQGGPDSQVRPGRIGPLSGPHAAPAHDRRKPTLFSNGSICPPEFRAAPGFRVIREACD